MLTHSRQHSISNGVEILTPLLIPSFSSLARKPISLRGSAGGKPELIHYSKIHSANFTHELEESLLISAYDIGHGLLEGVHAFRVGFKQSYYARPRLLVIDSGGYEKLGIPSGSPFAEGADEPLPWEESDYVRVVDSLDREAAPAVVNWDSSESYAEQIRRAREFFDGRRHLGSVFLLKTPEWLEYHNLELLSSENVGLLGTFDVVGVTEREIGESIHDRLVNIARLRKLLDTTGTTVPIHVFGGLDPLLTPLYFAAGAEIFDGLGWLRYAYRDGVAMHREAGGLLSGNVKERPLSAEFTVWRQNLREITQLSEYMRQFAEHEDWDVYGRHSECLRAVIESVQEELEA